MQTRTETGYFNVIVDSIQDPIVVIGTDYRVRFANAVARKALQVDLSGGQEVFCFALIRSRTAPCEDEGSFRCPMRQVLETGLSSKAVIHRNTHGDNNMRVHEITATPIFNDQGEIEAVVEILRDVTDSILAEELSIQEQRYKSLFDATPDAIVTADANGVIVECNRAVEQLFGIMARDIIGKPVEILMPERLRKIHAEAVQGAARENRYTLTGKTLTLTGWREPDGEFPIELSLSTWISKGKRYLTAHIRDFSQRQALENSLQQEKARLEEAQRELLLKHEELTRIFRLVEQAKKEWEMTMDCMGDMVLLVDDKSLIQRCNRAFSAFIQTPFTEISGRQYRELLTAHDFEATEYCGQGLEFYHRPTLRSFVLYLYPFKGNGYMPTGSVITIHETTELRKTTRELEIKNEEIEDNRRKLQEALDRISSLIQRTAGEKDFGATFSNPNLKKCWEVMGCKHLDCPCFGKDPQRCWQKAGTFCKGQVQGKFAEKIGNCTNCLCFQEATADPIDHISEQFNNMMHILAGKSQELEDAYQELKESQTTILQQEKMASIGQLAAGVAHEINNPIGFISSNLGSLQKYLDRMTEFMEAQSQTIRKLAGQEAEELAGLRKKLKLDYILGDSKDLIRESLDGADRVKKIVQDLKSFSRVDQTEHKLADLNECMESTINIVWNELKYKAVLKKDFGTLPLTKCFPQQLNQVFMNLLVNAAQAIEKQGEIVVRTWHEEDAIFISVSDTGCGIAPDHVGRIFEPFFTTKEVGKGTGLGLSITYDIVKKKHGGEITVQSEVGKGTTFVVKIPVEDME